VIHGRSRKQNEGNEIDILQFLNKRLRSTMIAGRCSLGITYKAEDLWSYSSKLSLMGALPFALTVQPIVM